MINILGSLILVGIWCYFATISLFGDIDSRDLNSILRIDNNNELLGTKILILITGFFVLGIYFASLNEFCRAKTYEKRLEKFKKNKDKDKE